MLLFWACTRGCGAARRASWASRLQAESRIHGAVQQAETRLLRDLLLRMDRTKCEAQPSSRRGLHLVDIHLRRLARGLPLKRRYQPIVAAHLTPPQTPTRSSKGAHTKHLSAYVSQHGRRPVETMAPRQVSSRHPISWLPFPNIGRRAEPCNGQVTPS